MVVQCVPDVLLGSGGRGGEARGAERGGPAGTTGAHRHALATTAATDLTHIATNIYTHTHTLLIHVYSACRSVACRAGADYEVAPGWHIGPKASDCVKLVGLRMCY